MELAQRVSRAQRDDREMDRLVADYLPFIRSEASKVTTLDVEREDKAGIAMLVFLNCARQYREEKGAFLPFAAACIRNRLIDEGEKQTRRRARVVPLYGEDDEPDAGDTASLAQYDREEERRSLAEEIDALSAELAGYGVAFKGLADAGPRQKRSRELCHDLARLVLADDALLSQFRGARRLPQAELARRGGVAVRTLEKHRAFIVTLIVILSGDYPGIRTFLPAAHEEVTTA